MTELDVKLYPDPILREKCIEVQNFDIKLSSLLDNMAETMYQAHGIGLAAPQIGIAQQIVVIDVSETRNSIIELINPRVIKSEEKVDSEEGCLSIPGYRDTVTRYNKISVEAQNRSGETIKFDAEELLAICVQHELDHLNGVLFIDYLSPLKRKMFKNWYKKNVLNETSNT